MNKHQKFYEGKQIRSFTTSEEQESITPDDKFIRGYKRVLKMISHQKLHNFRGENGTTSDKHFVSSEVIQRGTSDLSHQQF